MTTTTQDSTSAAAHSEPDDRELILAAQRGDRNAYGKIVEKYREQAFVAALSILRNHEDARDLSQDAFIKGFESLQRFDVERPFYPWLYRILRNKCLNYIERHGPKRKVSLDALIEEHHIGFEAPTKDVRESIHAEEMAILLRAAIDQLKPEFREIILMKHIQGMQYSDIAEILEIPEGTVMSRLFHARKALAVLMEPHR